MTVKDRISETVENLLSKGVVPLSLIKDKVRYRRARVIELSLRGHKQIEIAKHVGCSLSTIEKDLKMIREKGGESPV